MTEAPEMIGAYPKISQAIGLVVVSMVLVLVFDIPVWIATRPKTEIRSLGMEISRALSTGLVLWWGLWRTRLPFRDVFPFKRFRVTRVVPIVLMLLGAVILAADINAMLQTVWPKPAALKAPVQDLFGGSVPVMILGVIVLGPLTEELLFRGLILQGFLRSYGRRKAIVGSALLFALWHLSPWQFPVAFILGIVLGWWMVATGSLLPCVFGHALANSLPLLISMTRTRQVSHAPAPGLFWPAGWLVLGLLGAAFIAAGVWLARRKRSGSTG